jgi:hypothetical protein
MSKITELASGQINSTHSLKIEFVEAEETPGSGHHPLAGQRHRGPSAPLPLCR